MALILTTVNFILLTVYVVYDAVNSPTRSHDLFSYKCPMQYIEPDRIRWSCFVWVVFSWVIAAQIVRYEIVNRRLKFKWNRGYDINISFWCHTSSVLPWYFKTAHLWTISPFLLRNNNETRDMACIYLLQYYQHVDTINMIKQGALGVSWLSINIAE